MNQKRKLSLAGVGALGAAALLLSGCGGNSFSKQTFGNYAEVVPVAYGLDPIAINPNLQLTPVSYELSGLGSPDGKTAYLTAATAFSIVTNSGGATLPVNVDTGLGTTPQLPYGFSINGVYIDKAAGAGVSPAAAQSGASVTFRAALANGVANNATPPIASASLSSTDPEWTLGTLPLTFNDVRSGPLANGTYVTGTNGTPTPFTLPFTTGIHSVVVTVTDAVGRVTATTFAIPVVATTDSAVLANVVATVPDGYPKNTTATITAATATITAPITGAVSQPTIDAQSNVVLFASPGDQTVTATAQVTITPPTGDPVNLIQTGTLPVTLVAGGTISNAVVTVAGTTPDTAPAAPALRKSAVRRH